MNEINQLPVWTLTDIQSGDTWYSLDEPDRDDRAYYLIRETTFEKIPEFFQKEFMPSVHYYL